MSVIGGKVNRLHSTALGQGYSPPWPLVDTVTILALSHLAASQYNHDAIPILKIIPPSLSICQWGL